MPDASAPDQRSEQPSEQRSDEATETTAMHETAAREAFAVLAAHAIRGVTQSISGSLELLAKPEPGETLSPRQRDLVQSGSAATARLIQVSDDLQTLTHAAGHTLQARRQLLTLTTLLREAIAQASATASRKAPREITSRVFSGASLALGDPELARRALVALIENALRFSPPETPVTVEARKHGQHAIIRVQDRGTRLIAADVEPLFAPLISGADPRSHEGVGLGLGLGLAVARACAEAQQGRVWLERATGEGATFAFELPLATATEE